MQGSTFSDSSNFLGYSATRAHACMHAREHLVALHDLLALNNLVDGAHHVLHGCQEKHAQLWF